LNHGKQAQTQHAVVEPEDDEESHERPIRPGAAPAAH
jgi:hypothetical protein